MKFLLCLFLGHRFKRGTYWYANFMGTMETACGECRRCGEFCVQERKIRPRWEP